MGRALEQMVGTGPLLPTPLRWWGRFHIDLESWPPRSWRQDCSQGMPFALGHLALHKFSVGLGGRWVFPAMTPHIAQPTRCCNIDTPASPSILLGHQVLSGALKRVGCPSAKAQWCQFFWGGAPHGEIAVTAAATLGLEGGFTGGFIAIRHMRVLNGRGGSFSQGLVVVRWAPGAGGGICRLERRCFHQREGWL